MNWLTEKSCAAFWLRQGLLTAVTGAGTAITTVTANRWVTHEADIVANATGAGFLEDPALFATTAATGGWFVLTGIHALVTMLACKKPRQVFLDLDGPLLVAKKPIGQKQSSVDTSWVENFMKVASPSAKDLNTFPLLDLTRAYLRNSTDEEIKTPLMSAFAHARTTLSMQKVIEALKASDLEANALTDDEWGRLQDDLDAQATSRLKK